MSSHTFDATETTQGPGTQPTQAATDLPISARDAATRLRNSYRHSLGAVALLLVVAQAFLQITLWASESDGKVVNVAGRQRMLSQRTAKLSLMLHGAHQQFPQEHLQHAGIRDELTRSFGLLARSHKQLRAGPAEPDLDAPITPEIEARFAELVPRFEALGRGVNDLTAASFDRDVDGCEQALEQVMAAEGPFLKTMHALVGDYEMVARGRIITMAWWSAGLCLAALLMLWFVARYILRPAVGWLRSRIEMDARLQESELAAHQAREQTLKVLTAGFKAPLQAIRGAALGMSQEDEPPQGAATITREADQMLRQLETMLALEQEDESCGLDATLLDVGHLIRSTVGLLQPKADAHGVNLDVITPEEEVLVESDRQALQQVVLALLDNGVKFAPTGNVQVLLRAPDHTGNFEIQVADDGCGIPLESLESVFERFVQLPDAQGQSPEGAGLGLTLARDRARAMAGQLTLASDVGTGTSALLRLPASVSDTVPAPPIGSPA